MSNESLQQLRQSALVWLASAALLLVVYFPALRGDFVWDDDRHVAQNITLRSGEGLWRIWTEPGATPQYYPLTHTTFWIEYQVWGNASVGYHIDNVLLHALSFVLAWRLLSRLHLRGTLFIAALWAFHPLQVESVAWISERKNVLSMVFYLSALLMYLRVEKTSGLKSAAYLVSFTFFVCAMLSKTVACSMPAVALLLVAWTRGLTRRDLLRLLPFFIVGIGLSLVTARMERDHVGASGAEWQISLLDRICIASRAVWFYAAKFVWPAKLTFNYPRWTVNDLHVWRFVFVAMLIAVAGALVALRRKTGNGPIVGLAIFVGVLFPALGFVNTYPIRYSFVADHFSYMASLALAAVVGSKVWRSRALSVVVVLLLASFTFHQSRIFAGPEPLWRSVIANNRDSWLAHHNLGVTLSNSADPLMSAGRVKLGEALHEFDMTEMIRPEHEHVWQSRGNALFKLSRWREAIDAYSTWIAKNNPRPRLKAAGFGQIALAYEQLGEFENAETNFRQAIKQDRLWSATHSALVEYFVRRNDVDGAAAASADWINAKPASLDALRRGTPLLAAAGRWDEAITDAETLTRFQSGTADDWRLLGELYLQRKLKDQAAAAFKEALKRDPSDLRSRQRLLDLQRN